MKPYYFSGHLTPLPPGIRIGLQLSGYVYLVDEVEAWKTEQERRYERELTRHSAMADRLRATMKKHKRELAELRKANAANSIPSPDA